MDILAAQSRARSTNNFNYNNGDIAIRRDNAFLPANILALMVANNLQTVTLGRLNTELGLNTNTTRNHYFRAGGGLKGKLFADWTWEVGANYTRGLSSNEGRNNRNNINWNLALDSVIGPNGAPICRSTLTNAANGCVPANVFGTGSLSQAVVNYATGTSSQRSFSHEINANADVGGQFGRTWAGPDQGRARRRLPARRRELDFRSDLECQRLASGHLRLLPRQARREGGLWRGERPARARCAVATQPRSRSCRALRRL